MFLRYTSQCVDIVMKWLISLVVTSNHKCLNKVVSSKLALIIFESRTQPQRWYILVPNKGLETKSICYLRAQRLRKAMLAAIYIYPVYVEYRRKFVVQISKTPVSRQGR